MKLRNILLYIAMLMFITTQFFANTNPVVSNVAFTINGTTVTVTYDVADAEQNTFTIYMEVSENSGSTWDFDYGTATGAIGAGVQAGIGKTITWTYNGSSSATMIVKILADDLFGDQIYYSYKIYNTVTIAAQTWLKENLDVGDFLESNGSGDNQTDNGTIEKYCCNNDENNCDTYGGLYQWNEAMQYVTTEGTQGICPNNWHIPTYAELQTLSDAVGGSSNALKAIGQGSGSGAGTNTSGFSALLAGSRNYYDGGFRNLGSSTYFWDSTENGSDAHRMSLGSSNDIVGFNNSNKNNGFSVRCLKD